MQALGDLINVRSWSSETVDGDVSSCAGVAEDSPIWPYVTSTSDNCLGSDCPLAQRLLRGEGAQKAMDADGWW
ncbi:hypothetical protein ACE0DR_29090 [Azotobacter sp. CWF10]